MNFRDKLRGLFGGSKQLHPKATGPLKITDILTATEKLTQQRQYRLAREQFRELERSSLTVQDRCMIAYNRGVFDWVHIGDGIEARKHFSVARDLAKTEMQESSSRHILANTAENLMVLAISYEEFYEEAETLAELSPSESILQQQLPQTRLWQKDGLPWNDVMCARSRDYWNEDPQLDPARYGCAASILQVMLSHRKQLRIDAESYRTWLHTWVTLLFRHFDASSDEQQVIDSASHWELNVLFEPTITPLEKFVAGHLLDKEMLEELRGVRSMIMDIDHYDAVLSRFPGPLCPLQLIAAESNGPNLLLVYQWSNSLTAKEADNVDTRARAFVNSAVGFAAIAQWVGCRNGPNDASLLGVPIPGWYLEDRQQPTYVQNSQFDTDQKTVQLTLGPRFIDARGDNLLSDPVSSGLKASFKTFFTTISV